MASMTLTLAAEMASPAAALSLGSARDVNDDRLTWPERELIRRLGEKLYGKREPRHG